MRLEQSFEVSAPLQRVWDALIDDGSTNVNLATDYHITGRLARFGRAGMIEEISNQLLKEFAANLQELLAGILVALGLLRRRGRKSR